MSAGSGSGVSKTVEVLIHVRTEGSSLGHERGFAIFKAVPIGAVP